MDNPEQQVYIVDDDEAILDSLTVFLQSTGYEVQTYTDPEAFLAEHHPGMAGCLLLDIRMPSMSGLELQEALMAVGSSLPIIFITGHADVPTAVQALKQGAYDFIQKPFDNTELLGHINKAFAKDRQDRAALHQQQAIQERLRLLTPRETEVLDYIANGKATKVIASELNLSQRTVEIYRANVMQKMQSRSVAQLVRMLNQFDSRSDTA